ncbi:MAG: mevalonate kinase [Anaerolineales bacterium]|nr:mevalonate kinase [Anaerolineales bacterium]MCX7608216.1 mevalonate kinase [Anaerolineales bacterium]MDW8227037.1 mevalonate kinase [Anaerolineales bacterium]
MVDDSGYDRQAADWSARMTASAPGKIILFGEHAVVYGRPALAVPVTEVRATASVQRSTDPGVWLEAPVIGLRAELSCLPQDHPLAAAVRSVFSTLDIETPPDCVIHVDSTIPVASGLGSGAAVSVAVIRALAAYLGHRLPDERVSALAYEIEKLHHGTPSGIDNTVITYAQPVYFVRGQAMERLQVGAPFTLVIGNSGIPAPTKESVGDVRRLWEADPPRWEKVFDQIADIVRRARELIENGAWRGLGKLMDTNHALLQELTVSSEALDRLVEAARRAGALGAKLSGGGRGGNMIALVERQNAPVVAEALLAAGATQTMITQVD